MSCPRYTYLCCKDNHLYYRNGKAGNHVRYKCKKDKLENCKAEALVNFDENFVISYFRVRSQHTHLADLEEVASMEVEGQALSNAVANRCVRPRQALIDATTKG